MNTLLVSIATHYSPLVVITHSPWDKKQKRAAGTVTQAANFAINLHFEKTVNKESTFVHITVDSKLGAEETGFTLRLETEGDEVRGFVYEASGWHKGAKKSAVVQALEEDPSASTADIAKRFGISERHVQKIRKTIEETADITQRFGLSARHDRGSEKAPKKEAKGGGRASIFDQIQ